MGLTSIKHEQIDKARSNMVVVVMVATIIVVFCLMSSKALLSQAAYQRKVVNARHAGLHQLQANVAAANQLVSQYNNVFEGTDPTNIIGGNNDKSTSAVPPNGDNARIVLDALPSKYDFPALLTSVSFILSKNGVQNASITGDDETATASNSATTKPSPVEITFSVGGNDSYAGVQGVIHDFEHSIRPFSVTSIQLGGAENNMSFTFNVTTYYQPPKSLDLTTKEIH